MPREIGDRLATALAPFKNRDAAYTLAVFLARFWSAPGRIVEVFHIDRRALAEHGELGLTEKRIRSAITTLEEIGFIDRAVASGSKYKPTENGLHRKPIRFQFGSEYFPLFDVANRRTAAARGRRPGASRSQALVSSYRASTGSAAVHGKFVTVTNLDPLNGPKIRNPSERSMNLGPLMKECGLPASAFDPNPKLEAALARFEEGFRQSRGG